MVREGLASPLLSLCKVIIKIMIKAIFRFFKNFYEKEIDYTFEFEFSIYDVIFGALIIFLALWKVM